MTAYISLFKNARETKPVDSIAFEDYIEHIRVGSWEDYVYDARENADNKVKVPAVTPSGVFERRKHDSLKDYSGIIVMDIDDKDNDDLPESIPKYMEYLMSDPYILAVHRSISGRGLAIYFKVEKRPARHRDNFESLERYLLNTYHLVPDPSGKDLPRLRFVSYDPDIYYNHKARLYRNYIKKEDRMPVKTYAYRDKDIQYILDQISNHGIDITADYADWVKIGFALASEYGEQGREMFHTISQNYDRYNRAKTDKKYSQIVKSNRGKVTIGTLIWLAQKHGIKRTRETRYCENVAKNGKREDRSKEDVIRLLVEHEKVVNKEYAEDIVSQVYESKDKDFDSDLSENLYETLAIYLKMNYRLKRNEITRNVEIDGKPLGNEEIHDIYLDYRTSYKKALEKSEFFTMLESNRVPSYNPFFAFIDKRKHLRPKGCVDALAQSVVQGTFEDPILFSYFLKKWLLGIIASIHGVHSVGVLVLTGKQGTGKTRFFRELLPPSLRSYYAESSLEHNKDADILMCRKLIIMDDEFGGKNKRDAKKFKELTSRDTFSIREPYARKAKDYKRLAVLCGTSNDDEVLVDPTGNRRIVPIHINSIDYEKYSAVDKEELFMELYWIYDKDPDLFMMTSSDIEILHQHTEKANAVTLEWEAVNEFFRRPEENEKPDYMMSGQIEELITRHWRNARLSHVRLGQELKRAGFERKMKRMSGARGWYWDVRIQEKYRKPADDL